MQTNCYLAENMDLNKIIFMYKMALITNKDMDGVILYKYDNPKLVQEELYTKGYITKLDYTDNLETRIKIVGETL